MSQEMWLLQDLTDGMSRLTQVMTRCHQATSHHLNQSWPNALIINDCLFFQMLNMMHMFGNKHVYMVYKYNNCNVIAPEWVNPCGLGTNIFWKNMVTKPSPALRVTM